MVNGSTGLTRRAARLGERGGRAAVVNVCCCRLLLAVLQTLSQHSPSTLSPNSCTRPMRPGPYSSWLELMVAIATS